MGERRRLADDLVGVPRWGRFLVYGVMAFMGVFAAAWPCSSPTRHLT